MALVPGKNTLDSGTGSWTIVLPTDTTIAIDDPPTRPPIPPAAVVPPADLAVFPHVKLTIELRDDSVHVIQFVGDESTRFPNPPDSVGFTANVEIDVINHTGHALAGLTLDLATSEFPPSPLNVVPGIIEYGETVNANYAFFSGMQPVAGETTTLFSPLGQPTTPTGPAASVLSLAGNIANGATVSTVGIIHETESTAGNNFSLAVTDAPASPRFMVGDQSTGESFGALGEAYAGPVAGIRNQIILAGADNINVTPTAGFCFIHTGSGDDGLDVSAVGGDNILDGGTGSNFMVGGSGHDTFFVDDRGPKADIWTSIKGFHSGDNATIFGITPQDFNIAKLDGQGAPGNTGLTFSITAAGKPNANLTMVGFSTADINSGKLAVSFGRTDDLPGLPGSTFMLIHGV